MSDFRKIHLEAFRPPFLDVLRLAGEMGMVKLGNLSTDGTKIGANASRHKAMSYGYMNKKLDRLKAEIDQLLEQAEQIDAEQDAALGSRRGDELPEELKRREDRLAKILEAKARLEAEARAGAEEEQRRRDEEQTRREAEGRPRRGKEPAPVVPTPEDKAQVNFTDPEAKIMKRSNKGFDYSYNAQAVVDSEAQIIVAAEATNAANDKQQAVPMAQAALNNLDAAGIERPKGTDGTPLPIPNTADTGYYSKEAVEGLEKLSIDPYLATGRQKHHEPPAQPSTATPLAEASIKEKTETPLGDRQGSLRGAEADRRAGVRYDQVYAGNSQVSVTGIGEGIGRVATDLPDPQSSEDVASRQPPCSEISGDGARRELGRSRKAKAQQKPRSHREARANSRTRS